MGAGIYDGITPLGRWEDDIKIDLKGKGYENRSI
jgi:hypothetical protein